MRWEKPFTNDSLSSRIVCPSFCANAGSKPWTRIVSSDAVAVVVEEGLLARVSVQAVEEVGLLGLVVLAQLQLGVELAKEVEGVDVLPQVERVLARRRIHRAEQHSDAGRGGGLGTRLPHGHDRLADIAFGREEEQVDGRDRKGQSDQQQFQPAVAQGQDVFHA